MSETIQEGGNVNAAEEPEVTEATKGKEKVEKKPRQTFKEKFADSTNEEERVELAEKVAELRLDTEATRAPAWKAIREHEDVCLSSDEFHKIIRVSDYYEKAMLGRLESQIDEGWVYTGSLHTLCGFDVPGGIVEKMESNKAKAKAAAKPAKKEEGDAEGNSDDSEGSNK